MKNKIISGSIILLLLAAFVTGATLLGRSDRQTIAEKQVTSKMQKLAQGEPEVAGEESDLPEFLMTAMAQEEFLLRRDEIQCAKLVALLRNEQNQVSAHIYSLLSPPVQALVQQYRGQQLTAQEETAVVDELNRLIRIPGIYHAEKFKQAGVQFSFESRKFIEQKQAIVGDELLRFNRLLLVDAYPQAIKKMYQAPPRMERKPGQSHFQAFAALLALLGAPLFAVIGAIASFLTTSLPTMFVNVLDKLVASSSLFVTLPLFTFAGFVLSESKAPERLVRFSQALLGWLPGGTALIAVVSCAFFTAFTGASGVTIIAVGGLLYPILIQSQYSQKFSLGLLTSSGSLGLLFPPSLPLILYAVIANNCLQGTGQEVDIRALFLAGLLPGIILLLVLALYGSFFGSRSGESVVPFNAKALKTASWVAFPELLLPVILGGGFFSGLFDIEESAAITAGYVLFVEMVVYREVTISSLFVIIKKSMILFGAILVILMMAIALTSEVIDAKVPDYLLSLIREHIASKITFLILLNLLLLIVGCMMDIFSAILVVVPLIVPIAVQYDVHPLHLGIIFLVNLEIGYSTPPVGMNLFIASLRFKETIWKLCLAVLPFLAIRVAFLALITFVPATCLYLVNNPRGIVGVLLLFPFALLLVFLGNIGKPRVQPQKV